MNSSNGLILIAEDESALNDLLQDALKMAGYQTVSAKHGQEAVKLIREKNPDLVILDINMPRMDGFEVLEKIRAENNTVPVIVLTARDEKDDKAQGFRLGADDFVTKPFGLEELLLRVAAVLRRSRPNTEQNLITVGDLKIDLNAYKVYFVNSEIELSPTEYKLLEYLVENKDRVMTREQILSAIWGIDFVSDSAVLDTYISYLRKKLPVDIQIRTVRGIGYQIEAR